MFDFSNYNLGELNAIYEMLDYIDHGGSISYQMSACNEEIAERMDQMSHSQQAPAVMCCNIDRCGVCLTDCPHTDEPLPAGADDLCAAVEVLE